MGFFNFSNSTQQQISNDVDSANRIIRGIINKVDPLPLPLPYRVKVEVIDMMPSVEPIIDRIKRNVSQLSDRQMMNTKVVGVNGESMSINNWLLMFSMFFNQLSVDLES